MFTKILFYGVIKPLSYLPYPILYGISNFLYVVFFYVVGYRKNVVLNNLQNSFPNKTTTEINTIAKGFYKHFADLIVESVKLFSISQKNISKRFTVNNPEVLNAYADSKQSIILVGGHYNNWEMLAVGIDHQIKHQSVGLYTKLSNPFFEKMMLESRSKFGLRMVRTKQTSRYFEEDSANNTVTIFGADQSPTYNKNVYWTTFLNQETAVAFGTERYAKKFNYPVLFGSIHKVKRGYYSFDVQLITENPLETEDGYITEQHTRMLENQINQEPSYWLWTHKRWKRKRKNSV